MCRLQYHISVQGTYILHPKNVTTCTTVHLKLELHFLYFQDCKHRIQARIRLSYSIDSHRIIGCVLSVRGDNCHGSQCEHTLLTSVHPTPHILCALCTPLRNDSFFRTSDRLDQTLDSSSSHVVGCRTCMLFQDQKLSTTSDVVLPAACREYRAFPARGALVSPLTSLCVSQPLGSSSRLSFCIL